jgi:Leucine-rich repeat (LRR) protein
MKRLVPYAALIFASLASAAVADDLFPDKALEAVVRQQVFEKRNKPDPLVEDDVKNIAIISGKGKKITNLAGLEKCKSLLSLDLENNEIADLAPIKDLKLIQSLNIAKNKITSIAPLAELTALQYIEMQNNQVSDLSPLAKIKPLGFLDVSHNQVKDIAPLAELTKLHALYLTANPIEDFKPLASLKNIERLDLRNTGISDLSPLAELTEWQSHLFLHGNKITDLSVLVAMAKKDFEGQKRFAPFWKVYLGENPLSDAAKTAQIEELKKYGVRVSLTYP